MSPSRGFLLETWTSSRFQPVFLKSPSRWILLKTWASSRFQPWALKSVSRGILLETWTSGRFLPYVSMSLSRGILLETWTYSRFQPSGLISPSWGIVMETWISTIFQPWISMSPSRLILLETWTSNRFQPWALMSSSKDFWWILGRLSNFNHGSGCLQVGEFCWRQDIWHSSTNGLDVSKSWNSVGDRTSGRFQLWVVMSPSRWILLETGHMTDFKHGSWYLQAEEFYCRIGHLADFNLGLCVSKPRNSVGDLDI